MNSEYVNVDKASETEISVLPITDEITRLEKLLTDAEKKLKLLEKSKIRSDKAHKDLVKTLTGSIIAQQEVNIHLQNLYKESKKFAEDQDSKLFEEFQLREKLYIRSMKKIFIGILVIAGLSIISLVISSITLFCTFVTFSIT